MQLLNILFRVCWKYKNADIICYVLSSLVSLQPGYIKTSEKSMKIVNIEGENLHLFSMTWGISTKFSEKMWLMIILKATKKQGCTLSRENIYFWKTQEKGLNLPHPQPF